MAWLFAAASLLLGIGSVASSLDVGTWLVVSATFLTAVGLFAGTRLKRVISGRSLIGLIAVGTGIGAAIMAIAPAVADLRFSAGYTLIGLIALHALMADTRWRLAEFLLVVIGHFLLMSWMLIHLGPPVSDVFRFQQEAAAALLDGTNPYGLRYENLAGPGSPYYSSAVEDGDRLTFGFVYPPLSLLLALPGYLIAADYRFAALAAISASCLLIALARRNVVALGASMLVMFSPVVPRILYWGWSEPFVALMLALTAFLALRSQAATAVTLGLLIATKQYVIPLYPLALVLLRYTREKLRWRWLALTPLAVAALTLLPFLIWDVGSFVYSTVTFHNLQPFRADSLSVPALLVRADLIALPPWIGFVLAGATFIAVIWLAPRTVAGYCGGAMLVLLVFFLFGKQAHMNYYFLVIVGLACGIGAAIDPKSRQPQAVVTS